MGLTLAKYSIMLSVKVLCSPYCLLPYSQQLASIDRIWTLARRTVPHNRFFATVDDVLTFASTSVDNPIDVMCNDH